MKKIITDYIHFIFSEQKNNYDYDWRLSLKNLDEHSFKRIEDELTGWGPIATLISDDQITEILTNAYDQVFYEKCGKIIRADDHFYSEKTYTACLDRIAQSCHTYLCREKPFVEVQNNRLRITMIYPEISRGQPLLSIRIQPLEKWSLNRFKQLNFITESQYKLVHNLLQNRNNFLVVGATSTGKTSFLQALLEELHTHERALIIEDTQELQPSNPTSTSLLSRHDPARTVPDVTLDDLLKRALRLRPDRLVVGEVRGPEAKSLLLSLSSGHDGSFGSLHARSAHEALLRLEMLIQMGAPQWNLQSIRKLIAMTLDYIIVLEKKNGLRKIKGVYKINSLEETGFTLSRADDEDSID